MNRKSGCPGSPVVMPDFDFILLLPVFHLFQERPQSKICGFLYYRKSACGTKEECLIFIMKIYSYNKNLKGEFLC